jgi:hypothetical protein
MGARTGPLAESQAPMKRLAIARSFRRREERLVSSAATIKRLSASTAGAKAPALFEYRRLRNGYSVDGALARIADALANDRS